MYVLKEANYFDLGNLVSIFLVDGTVEYYEEDNIHMVIMYIRPSIYQSKLRLGYFKSSLLKVKRVKKKTKKKSVLLIE